MEIKAKQSSKPQIGVRPPSGSRPASGYKGTLASAKYFDGPNDLRPKINQDASKFGFEDLFNTS
jgi:hypothetical protein